MHHLLRCTVFAHILDEFRSTLYGIVTTYGSTNIAQQQFSRSLTHTDERVLLTALVVPPDWIARLREVHQCVLPTQGVEAVITQAINASKRLLQHLHALNTQAQLQLQANDAEMQSTFQSSSEESDDAGSGYPSSNSFLSDDDMY